ncbi:MAG: hypothetical protein WCK77_16055 [Verrucomicrobiota bacterium]
MALAAPLVSASPIPVQSFQTNADGITLTMSPGTMKLTVCSDSIVRVMYSPTATLPTGQTFVVTKSWQASPFQVADSIGSVTLSTAKLKVVVDKPTGEVLFYDSADHLLLGESAGGGKTMSAVTVNGESAYRPHQSFESPADEFIYGLGEYQEGIWNWRGMPQQLRQCNTQLALPMIVSSYGYGLLWNNASLSDFNPADTEVPLTNGSGTFTTGAAGEYVFFVKDGNRSSVIGVQVNGLTLANSASDYERPERKRDKRQRVLIHDYGEQPRHGPDREQSDCQRGERERCHQRRDQRQQRYRRDRHGFADVLRCQHLHRQHDDQYGHLANWGRRNSRVYRLRIGNIL